jgi:hypothetical protein
MKDDLQQKIAELLLEIGEIAAGNGVGNFISFFQRIRSNRRKILRQIPGAAGTRSPQRCHDFEEPNDVARRGHRQYFLLDCSGRADPTRT